MVPIVIGAALILAFWPRLAAIGELPRKESELLRISPGFIGLSRRLAVHILALVLASVLLVVLFVWLAAQWPDSADQFGYGIALLVGAVFGFLEAVFATNSGALPSSSFFGLGTRYLYSSSGRIQRNGKVQIALTSVVAIGVVAYWLAILA